MDVIERMRSSRINLHNHTTYSDGDYTVEDVVRSAHESGLTHVAITDHFETAKVSYPLRRTELDEYLSRIRKAGESIGDGIKVLAGVEIDVNPQRCDLYDLPFDRLNRLDLVLFEYVDDPLNGGIPLNELRSLVKELHVPFGFCHWDMDRIYRDRDPEWLANKLADIGAFVEVPTSQHYFRHGRFLYEHSERFYNAFNGMVKVSIGTDMHHSLDQVGNIGRGLRFVRDNRLCSQMLFNEDE